MTDRPAIFSAPMVCALVDDRKTQTRRLATSPLAKCQPGDRLWVREAFAFTSVSPIVSTIEHPMTVYRERDSTTDYGGPWRPSVHMPRWASRLTLVVTDVRIQRLHDITEDDALAEGVVLETKPLRDGGEPFARYLVPGLDHPCKDFPELSRPTAREMYAALWDVIHGPGHWSANPWVIAISFAVHHCNIDTMKESG